MKNIFRILSKSKPIQIPQLLAIRPIYTYFVEVCMQRNHEDAVEGKQHDEASNLESAKDPETLSEGERMGLSKQQLRKLEKRLAAKSKKANK